MEDIEKAKSNNTTKEELAILARHSNYVIRGFVAENLNTSSEVLELLAQDSNTLVRYCVTLNPNTSTNTLMSLVRDKIPYVSEGAAHNKNATEVIRRLFKLNVYFGDT